MDFESLDYKRSRWNRMLLNGFWFILVLTIILEFLYLTVSDISNTSFMTDYILRPSIIQLSVMFLAECGLKLLKGKYQDYILIFTSAILASVIVIIHNSINYLLLALFLPVMVSIFYFHTRKLLFAFGNTLSSLYVLYGINDPMREDLSLVSLTTITVMFTAFTLVAWGIILRGKELMNHLKSYFESNQQLLVKTIWMDKLAKTDALTELYNHMTFHEFFEKLIEQHERNQLPLQLALLDIDNFKHVNDTYGHRAGDRVLKQVADMIRSRASMNDFVARYGGEEFAVLFTDKSADDAYALVETIRQAIGSYLHEALDGKPVTVSIGFAPYFDGEGKERFFNRVDEALYKAKNSGKNKTIIASEPFDSKLVNWI
ncbi:GGDEF domain-containing protein [Paenibacillus mendelii]|uniref:GGDEF domain-containing protein n=1 Tax=Paenibacillus mendelii TaxID=206163 RepID=A0ABV6JIK0_9BACL|nr:GGDEF domain-containing protein [Paenibacillus mendelii]MCQ6558667.1 GGDEF domain-containing protein [Paenibacillus mendelii]